VIGASISRPHPETLRYCNYVADNLDLRRDITFNSRAVSAAYDEYTNDWELAFADGRRVRSHSLITAIGPLSAPTMPAIPGVTDFRGEAHHTGTWPHEKVSFEGKRVAVIGIRSNGSRPAASKPAIPSINST
jgi:cation diffusion facilitator CzcD-associated flavoprotein CzcO